MEQRRESQSIKLYACVGWLVLTPDFYAYIFSEMNEFYEAAGANNLQSARIPYIEFRVGFRTNEGVSNA